MVLEAVPGRGQAGWALLPRVFAFPLETLKLAIRVAPRPLCIPAPGTELASLPARLTSVPLCLLQL